MFASKIFQFNYWEIETNYRSLGPKPRKYHDRKLEFLSIRENFLSYSN